MTSPRGFPARAASPDRHRNPPQQEEGLARPHPHAPPKESDLIVSNSADGMTHRRNLRQCARQAFQNLLGSGSHSLRLSPQPGARLAIFSIFVVMTPPEITDRWKRRVNRKASVRMRRFLYLSIFVPVMSVLLGGLLLGGCGSNGSSTSNPLPVPVSTTAPTGSVWQNPFMALNPANNAHNDSYMSDTYPYPGPMAALTAETLDWPNTVRELLT